MTRLKVTARIGRANYRKLPEFEEYDLLNGLWDTIKRSGWDKAGNWHQAAHQFDDWRRVDNWDGRVSPEGGRINPYGWNCADCGGTHPLPSPKRALVCPRLPDAEARTRAIGRIEGKIAKARGQQPRVSDAILEDIAAEVVCWSELFPSWGRAISDEYRQHAQLGPYIRAIEDVPLPDGDNVRPPPELAEMIWKHLPLVRSLARQRARKVSNVAGWTTTDDALLSDLEEVGVQALEEVAPRFDPTRGVPFGAFAKMRVAGAMDTWLTHKRILFANAAYDMALNGEVVPDDGRTVKASKRHRSSTGAFKEKPFISTSVQPVRCPDGVSATRLIRRTINQDVEAALEKLNHRQRVVYRGRVLSDPPVPRSELAAQLKIKDETQIPRILKQAEQKMRRFLKVSPPR
jgi:RNA polymerase sigma factor (sigma-70 family)